MANRERKVMVCPSFYAGDPTTWPMLLSISAIDMFFPQG
jgi:hypothetical protein